MASVRWAQVITVDGTVDLKIPAGTQPGTTLVMGRRGVPRLGSAAQAQRGDHNVSLALHDLVMSATLMAQALASDLTVNMHIFTPSGACST